MVNQAFLKIDKSKNNEINSTWKLIQLFWSSGYTFFGNIARFLEYVARFTCTIFFFLDTLYVVNDEQGFLTEQANISL